MNARLVLLHVVQSPPFLINDYYGIDPGSVIEIVAIGEKAAFKQLEALRQRWQKKELKVKSLQMSGAPVPSIITQAGELKAAYIVIGSHGHGAVFDLFVGSTTHGVLRRARCPVLVVPTIRR